MSIQIRAEIVSVSDVRRRKLEFFVWGAIFGLNLDTVLVSRPIGSFVWWASLAAVIAIGALVCFRIIKYQESI